MGFLTGKTAIITGAGYAVLSDGRCGSIGYGIATAYAKEGANIAITGRNVKKLEADMKKYAQELGALMDADAAEASRLGFVGTPYFLVNDIVVRGALSLENFSDAVDMALAHIKKKK